MKQLQSILMLIVFSCILSLTASGQNKDGSAKEMLKDKAFQDSVMTAIAGNPQMMQNMMTHMQQNPSSMQLMMHNHAMMSRMMNIAAGDSIVSRNMINIMLQHQQMHQQMQTMMQNHPVHMGNMMNNSQ